MRDKRIENSVNKCSRLWRSKFVCEPYRLRYSDFRRNCRRIENLIDAKTQNRALNTRYALKTILFGFLLDEAIDLFYLGVDCSHHFLCKTHRALCHHELLHDQGTILLSPKVRAIE